MTKTLKIIVPNDGSHNYLKGKTARIYVDDTDIIKKGEFCIIDSVKIGGNVFSNEDFPVDLEGLFWMEE